MTEAASSSIKGKVAAGVVAGTTGAGVVSLKTIALEGAVLTALGIGAATVLAPHDAGLSTLFPHPIWLAIALLAARYGSRGLAVGVAVGWALTAFVALVLGLPLALIGARATSGADLGALLAIVMVAWVASTHERRCTELATKVASLKKRCASDREAVVALRSTAVALRGRADRLETSVTFLREVASRMEGTDRAAAAQGALDLAIARIGARAGVVAAIGGSGDDRATLVPLASHGTLSAVDPRVDITAAAALLNRRATRAIDISNAGNEASDLAAPILAEDGEGIVGLIVLRGVPQGGVGAAALHDLSLIAGWCARAVGGERRSLGYPYSDTHGETRSESRADGRADNRAESRAESREGSVVRFHV